jgi:hypothetical protein
VAERVGGVSRIVALSDIRGLPHGLGRLARLLYHLAVPNPESLRSVPELSSAVVVCIVGARCWSSARPYTAAVAPGLDEAAHPYSTVVALRRALLGCVPALRVPWPVQGCSTCRADYASLAMQTRLAQKAAWLHACFAGRFQIANKQVG